MNVAIAGLGLIGGSAAKAYHEAGHVLYGLDHDQTVLGFAQLAGVVDVPLDQNNVRECDCLLIALPPSAAIAFLQEWAQRQKEYRDREITKAEYFEWILQWPDSSDLGGVRQPKREWRKEI